MSAAFVLLGLAVPIVIYITLMRRAFVWARRFENDGIELGGVHERAADAIADALQTAYTSPSE